MPVRKRAVGFADHAQGFKGHAAFIVRGAGIKTVSVYRRRRRWRAVRRAPADYRKAAQENAGRSRENSAPVPGSAEQR